MTTVPGCHHIRGRCVETVIIVVMCLMKIYSPAVINVCAGHCVNFPEDVRFDGSGVARLLKVGGDKDADAVEGDGEWGGGFLPTRNLRERR